MRVFLITIVLSIMNFQLLAQVESVSKKWYDKISIGGYMQVRYNSLFETNPDLYCEQCDENWETSGGGLSLRRLRLTTFHLRPPRVNSFGISIN